MTFENAIKDLIEGKKLKKSYWSNGAYIQLNNLGSLFYYENGVEISSFILDRSSLILNEWVVYEEKPHLDERGKAYLRNFIELFKEEVCYIQKNISSINSEYEHLSIVFKKAVAVSYYGEAIYEVNLKDFKKGTMFKSLEVGRKYTLEDLDL